MQKQINRTYILLFLSALFSNQLLAQGNEPPEINHQDGGGPMAMRIEKGGPPAGPLVPFMLQNTPFLKAALEEIGVNAQTIDKILSISRSYRKTFDEKIIRLQREELNIKEELLKENPDLQSLQTMINRKTQVFGEVEFLQIKRDLEIKSVLSDEDYDKLKSAIMERMHRMMPRIHEGNTSEKGDKKRP